MSTRRSAEWPPKGPQKGPNGERLCRGGCGREVARSWCSGPCEHEIKMRCDPVYARSCVEERDRGVCARCGLDCGALQGALWTLKQAARGWDDCGWLPESVAPMGSRRREIARKLHLAAKNWMVRRGFDRHRKTLWDADHVEPVSGGGGGCELDNYATLCQICHKAKNRTEATRRAAVRKLAKDEGHQLKIW